MANAMVIGKFIDILENNAVSSEGASANDYFMEMTTDSLGHLMSGLEESDKLKIREMVEHIRIREKYEMLSMRRENKKRNNIRNFQTSFKK